MRKSRKNPKVIERKNKRGLVSHQPSCIKRLAMKALEAA